MSIPSTACVRIHRWKTGMNSSSRTAEASWAKNLTTILWRSIRRPSELQAAAVRRLDEELGLLHEPVRRVRRRARRGALDRLEEVVGELRAREGVPEQFRLHELLAELADHVRQRLHARDLREDELPQIG